MRAKPTINQIASDEAMEKAYVWLCKRRKDYHHNNDVWHLRINWATVRPHLSSKCHHLAGNGGGKGAVRAVQENIERNGFVFRSDVKGYYDSIDHDCLIEQLKHLVHDALVLKLLRGYMKYLRDDAWSFYSSRAPNW